MALLTESSDRIMAETVAGIAGASTLNDISIENIYTEDFSTNPLSNDWQIGAGWEWDAVNLRMKIV